MKFNPLQQNNIIILGCGFGGMLTALSLAKFGIRSTIIEAKSITQEVFVDDIRATAITLSSKLFLKNIGVWTELNKIAGKIVDIYIVDNKAPEMLHFSSKNVVGSGEAMGYIIKNSNFKKILLSYVKTNKYIKLLDKCSYQQFESTDDKCILCLENGMVLNCDLVIICEGHNSKIQKAYFTKKSQKYYDQTALTFNVTHEKTHNSTAVEHFMASGPFAILPLHDPHTSSIVWTLSNKQSEIIKILPLTEFEYLVQQNFGKFLGKISLMSKIAAYPLKAYITARYFHQKIVLIADSAHIVHPLAGQGLNMGIKDIEVLTGLINKHNISQFTLEQYQSLRYMDNKAMYLITDHLNQVFSNYSKALWRIRRIGFRIIECLTPLKSTLINYAIGIRWF